MLEFSFNFTLFLGKFLIHNDLALFNLLVLLVSSLLKTLKVDRIKFLCVFKLDALPDLLLHIFEHQLTVKLDFSNSVLSIDGNLVFVDFKLSLHRLFEDLSTFIILKPILIAHDIEVCPFLFQLNAKFILNLQDFTFLMLLESALVVISVST